MVGGVWRWMTSDNAWLVCTRGDLGNGSSRRTWWRPLNSTVAHNWKWGGSLSPPQALGDLAQTLALDPNFRVLVAHGLTDVQAPYFATALELARLPPFAHPERLSLAVYPGGHMFYMRDDSRKALREAARRLIEGP